ncbi:hypothetical protein B0H14DRAFT_3135896 [Mycena olivaceomarginata]|nr:hypothetical protein B0H14DRAFT_3135896 [Mycena olivaceomarginata]
MWNRNDGYFLKTKYADVCGTIQRTDYQLILNESSAFSIEAMVAGREQRESGAISYRRSPTAIRRLVTEQILVFYKSNIRDHKGIEWWPMETAIEDWEKSNLEDIEKFFNTELSSIVEHCRIELVCHKLVQILEGDFGWAASACAFVKSTHGRLDSPADRVRHLIISVDWAAEEIESESEPGWPPHPPQTCMYPDTDMRSFPVMPQRPSHVEGPPGPWLPIYGVGPYYAPGLVGEPEYY